MTLRQYIDIHAEHKCWGRPCGESKDDQEVDTHFNNFLDKAGRMADPTRPDMHKVIDRHVNKHVPAHVREHVRKALKEHFS